MFTLCEHMQQDLSQHKHSKESNRKLFFLPVFAQKYDFSVFVLQCNGVETAQSDQLLKFLQISVGPHVIQQYKDLRKKEKCMREMEAEVLVGKSETTCQ